MLSFARQILNRHFLLNWKLSETYQITPTFSKCEMICWKCKGYNLKTLPSSDFWICLEFRARCLCKKVFFWVQWVKTLKSLFLGTLKNLFLYNFTKSLVQNVSNLLQTTGKYKMVLNPLVSWRLLSPYLINFVYFGLR